jgi:hypothetical protein
MFPKPSPMYVLLFKIEKAQLPLVPKCVFFDWVSSDVPNEMAIAVLRVQLSRGAFHGTSQVPR